MNNINRSSRGQALIIMAFAIIGLVGMTALAIDGGNAYFDRRNAQNAADTSALATGLAVIRNESWSNAQSIGWSRASKYGYNNVSPDSVNIYQCTDPAASCGIYASQSDASDYMQVIITSHVKTYFAGVFGIPEVTNTVSAIVLAVPPVTTPLFNGSALVGLNKTACSAFNYQGGAGLTINDNGGGIFVNSDCSSTSNGAFNTKSGSASLTTPCLNVVGSITTGTNTTLNDNGCRPTTTQLIDPTSTYPQPNISCGQNGSTYTGSDGYVHLTPGKYSGAFPPTSAKNVVLDSGTFCIDAGNQSFSLSGQQNLTSASGGVMIDMVSGNVDWTSGVFNLSGQSSGYYAHLLLYLPDPSNCDNVKINANGVSSFNGTILAACSNVSIEGGANADGYNNQIIADTLSLSGNSNIVINYDSGSQWKPPSAPILELVK